MMVMTGARMRLYGAPRLADKSHAKHF